MVLSTKRLVPAVKFLDAATKILFFCPLFCCRNKTIFSVLSKAVIFSFPRFLPPVLNFLMNLNNQKRWNNLKRT